MSSERPEGIKPCDIPEGCRGGYCPETQALVALGHVDPDSLAPSCKSVPVRLRAAAAEA